MSLPLIVLVSSVVVEISRAPELTDAEVAALESEIFRLVEAQTRAPICFSECAGALTLEIKTFATPSLLRMSLWVAGTSTAVLMPRKGELSLEPLASAVALLFPAPKIQAPVPGAPESSRVGPMIVLGASLCSALVAAGFGVAWANDLAELDSVHRFDGGAIRDLARSADSRATLANVFLTSALVGALATALWVAAE